MRRAPRIRLWPWKAWSVSCLALLLGSIQLEALRANDQLLFQLSESLRKGDLQQAALLGDELLNTSDLSRDTTLPMARLARELQRAGDVDQALKYYLGSVRASERPEASSLPTQTRNMIRIATSLVLTEREEYESACDLLAPVVENLSGFDKELGDDGSIENASMILNRIGRSSLSKGEFAIAERAFQLAMMLSEKPSATLLLGHAWAVAMEGSNPKKAATELSNFLIQYPDHPDAPQAAMLTIECLQKTGDTQGTLNAAQQLLENWPDSESAERLVNEFSQTEINQIPRCVKNWLLNQTQPDTIEELEPDLLAIALISASEQATHPHWASIARNLARRDESGAPTSSVLNEFTQSSMTAEAERFAAILIAPQKPESVTSAAREAGCRWAGRESKWSMLALAAESESVLHPTPSRNSAVERLLAESLMQQGRLKDAARWWDYLVDVRGESDFSTLLRCAEAETGAGTDAKKAQRRIEAAKAVASPSTFQQALVSLLEAELLIRRSDFNRSRATLEKVVRDQSIEKKLRGRAQWLIGETHYLQKQYSRAIEAYRTVETIDPLGSWVAASLIQAGKSFEHLGHQREALICYGNLISRFSGSSHANAASKRLAAIDAKSSTSNPPTSGSIKR